MTKSFYLLTTVMFFILSVLTIVNMFMYYVNYVNIIFCILFTLVFIFSIANVLSNKFYDFINWRDFE